jgi:hypothetical protein
VKAPIGLPDALAKRARLPSKRRISALRTLGSTFVLTVAASATAWPVQAQQSFKTTKEMAHECIVDDRFLVGSCFGYILGSIEVLENAGRGRGEASCLAEHVSKDQIIQEIKRVILSQYADRGDLPALVLIEEFYQTKCKEKN